ncbi:MAG: hypothetical protein KDN20_20040, partial [Verrucomicrobiae bacterium]|nr:hypothetical protein [Verrucomicrobiae bacterium]
PVGQFARLVFVETAVGADVMAKGNVDVKMPDDGAGVFGFQNSRLGFPKRRRLAGCSCPVSCQTEH